MWDAQQLYNTRFHQECQQFFQYFFVLFAEMFFAVFLGQDQPVLTSQSASQTAPLLRGASGEEIKLSEMPRPPLVRGGGIASAMTERFIPKRAAPADALRKDGSSYLLYRMR